MDDDDAWARWIAQWIKRKAGEMNEEERES